MKTTFFTSLTFLVIISTLSFTPFRTGPSHAYYTITPFAYSDSGVVLCHTEYQQNDQGAHRNLPVHFGYLVVSAKGLWKEIPYYTTRDEFDYDSLDRLKKHLYAPVNLAKPPRKMGELIKTYNINNKIKETGKNKYYWTKEGLYTINDSLVLRQARQKAIKGKQSLLNRGTRIKNEFAIKGLVFFNNNKPVEGMHKGAVFSVSGDYGEIEAYTVTGICFSP